MLSIRSSSKYCPSARWASAAAAADVFRDNKGIKIN
jgi:hypothetical protein